MWKVLQYLMMQGILWQLKLLLPDCEILSSPDILSVLLIGFASMAWSTALESTVLGLLVLAWWLRFFQPKQNFLNCLVTFCTINVFSCFYNLVWTCKAYVPKLDYVTCSSVQFVNHSVNVSAHQLPLYYKPQQVPFTAWTASVTWYAHHKLAWSKILQNFWLTLVKLRFLYSLWIQILVLQNRFA